MAKRYTKAQHRERYSFLVERDGEQCRICERGDTLQIDHIDNNKNIETYREKYDNLQLLCHSHNASKGGRYRWNSTNDNPNDINKANHSDANKPTPNHAYESPPGLLSDQREREREEGVRSAFANFGEDIKDFLGYNEGSAELKANSYFERRFRDWVISKAKHDGYVKKDDAIYGATESLNFNPETARKYWLKMVSIAGPLAMNARRFGYPVWELKAQAVAQIATENWKSQARAQKKITPIQGRDGKRGS